ncbi:AIP3-domain-containing protein [Lichtheimia hyalospora FSU 10163]|nr:AIP3-domain-containing protein [Lichtheimia hyalospora FSU 10163]
MDQELEQQKATIVSFGSTLHNDDHVAPTQAPPPPPPPQQMPASPQQEARTASRSSSSTSLNQMQATIEQTVTQLLASTKNILQVLTGWSNQTTSAEQVMEVYRTLQEDFDHARQAFASMHVSIDEAAHVPNELHACLEAALAGPPSTATLEQHLPPIRETILQLLHALKQKQAQLRHEVPQRLPRRAGTIRNNNGERALSSSASDFDMDDPSTREALTALKQQDDLAYRSSVRRTAQQQHHHYRNDADLQNVTESTNDQTITSSPSIAPPPRRHPVTKIQQQQQQQHHDVGLTDSNKPKTLGDKHSNGDPSNANCFYLEDDNIVVYLQIHDRIKKAKIQQGDQQQPMTIGMLRQLFLDKFDHPMVPDTCIIHIRDPTSGIFYELEDIQDIVPHCLLFIPSPKGMQDIGEQQPPGWYQVMMDKLETIQKALQSGSDNENASVDMATTTIKKKHNPTMTANVDHQMLQQHQGAIQELRQDLGILRQIASEFQGETKSILDEMRDKAYEYCNKQHQALLGGQTTASSSSGDTTAKGVCGEQDKHRRHYLQETKDRSESTATHITTRLQDLQDTIDQLKLDVTQRRCRPSTTQLEHCEQEVADLDKEIDAFTQLLKKAKPIWKLVWEQELQNVVQEQQFLKEQEALVLDLRDDHADLVQVLKQLQKVHEIQTRQRDNNGNASSSCVKSIFPALSLGGDGSSGGTSSSIHYGGGEPGDMASVLKQVTTIDVDHTKRVKAMEHAEKMRARELANRIDDFEKELTAFVDAKKLKKTGGAEQVDRQRKQKDEQLLKALYSTTGNKDK